MRKFLLCLGLCVATLAVAEVPVQQQAGEASQQPASPPDAAQQPDLSDNIAQQVLEPLQQGMQTQNAQQVLGVFDKKSLADYSTLYSRLQALFQVFDQINFRYRLLQVTEQNGHASATAEIEMDALPFEAARIPERRAVQMRLELKQEQKGWKIMAFTPGDFFNVEYKPK